MIKNPVWLALVSNLASIMCEKWLPFMNMNYKSCQINRKLWFNGFKCIVVIGQYCNGKNDKHLYMLLKFLSEFLSG